MVESINKEKEEIACIKDNLIDLNEQIKQI